MRAVAQQKCISTRGFSSRSSVVSFVTTGMTMCARTCLFLRLLIAPLELLPPAGQVPLRLDGLALGGRRRFGPASDGLRSCRTAGSHGRGRGVCWDARCDLRLQHQALRGRVSGDVYAQQAAGGDNAGRSRDGCRATGRSAGAARVALTQRRRSCRPLPLCGRSAWRCTALQQRCGQRAVW